MRYLVPQKGMQMYLDGHHVYTHKEGARNAVFSEQFGEQMCTRHGKARGGLVGKTLSPDQVAIFNNVCNLVSLLMDIKYDYVDEEDNDKQSKHKKQRMNRKKSDSDDRAKIRN